MSKTIWNVDDIEKMVEIINEEAKEGLGLQAIADKRFMKRDGSTVNESTLRTALKKRGWVRANGRGVFTRVNEQNTKVTTDLYSHTEKRIVKKEDKIITAINTETFKKIIDKQELLLEFLEKLETNKKIEESMGNIKIEFDAREETKVTSIRVYSRALEEFNNVLSKQNIFTRQECISQALLDFARKLGK